MKFNFISFLFLAAATAGALSSARADYPIASQRYLADPASLVHNGRVYLYASNDDDNKVEGGYAMKSLVCISSSDLKNWTDHGEVLDVNRDAKWARNSWAPSAIERNGKFYLYFANNASGIGVVTSSSPTGPFTDPVGGALINSKTPGATGEKMWLFDPAVFINDDGQAYLYFGGNGENNIRVIRLNPDMISVKGEAIALSAPGFFEASWMHKRNGIYYFSYSTNTRNGLRIDYMTSISPISDFTYRGVVAPQPPSNNNNNHAAIFKLGDNWYHAYHNRIVAKQAGIEATYRRNLGLEKLQYNADGSIIPVVHTTGKLAQLAPLNPYSRVEAETMAAQSGIETETCNEGGMNLTALENGDWTMVSGVDFGARGARKFTARVASEAAGGTIEIRVGSLDGPIIGRCAVPNTGGTQTWADMSCPINSAAAKGAHDVYFRYSGGEGRPLFKLNWWNFRK